MFNLWDTASLIPKNTASERIPCADYSHELFYYFTSFHTFLYSAQAAYAIVILLIFVDLGLEKIKYEIEL